MHTVNAYFILTLCLEQNVYIYICINMYMYMYKCIIINSSNFTVKH